MAALPYMQLYVADYLADTAELSALEHGAYLLLLMTYWQRGKPLPADEAKLARIARCSTEEWRSVRDAVSGYFDRTPSEWRHKRIENDLRKVSEKSAKARASAKRTPSERSTDAEANGERTLSHTDTDTDTEEDSESNQLNIEQDVARGTADVLALAPAPDPFDRFPADGSIEWSPWAAETRAGCPGVDVDLVANRFRGFCHTAGIPLDRPGIRKTYASFCRTHARKMKGAA